MTNTFNCCLHICCLYLAAAGETLVVVGSPAGAVSVVLVLKEAGMWVFLQLLGVLHKEVVKLGPLHVPPGPELTVVWHVDLEGRIMCRKQEKKRCMEEKESGCRDGVIKREGEKGWLGH